MKYLKADATLSDCGQYRFSLRRIWDESKPPCIWIMLNPSTADGKEDDPTIRKCVGFAERLGCGGIYVVNLFSYRATKPKEMKEAVDPIGSLNDATLLLATKQGAKYIIAAWGLHGEYRKRGNAVKEFLLGERIKLHCLGRCKNGEPKHPLMLRYSTKLEKLA